MSEYTAIYRGSVYDIDDPENRGRIRLLIPQVLGDSPSAWAEPTLTTKEEASLNAGDRAWVIFEGGDLNRPTYISRMLVDTPDIAVGAVTPDVLSPEVSDAFDAAAGAGEGVAAALEAAESALNIVQAKNQVFRQPGEPTGGTYTIGDMWFDTDDSMHIRVWDGTAWVDASDAILAEVEAATAAAVAAATDALTAAESAMNFAETKNRVFRQDNAPTGGTYVSGDLWFDTNDNMHMRIWNGSAWVDISDAILAGVTASAAAAASTAATAVTDAANAQTAATNAQNTATAKNSVFVQIATPTALAAGDVWIDIGNGNVVMTATAPGTGNWVLRRDTTIGAAASAAAAAQTAAAGALTAAQAAQATADGAIRTYYQSSAPWTTNSDPAVLGDMWFDQDDGQAYRWNGTTWVVIEDSSIAVALAAAQGAQTTADGKIDAFYQDATPVIGSLGDLWFDTDDSNKPYYCSSVSPLTWTLVRDQGVTQALTDANTALLAANGKIKITYSTSLPGATANAAGDVWWVRSASTGLIIAQYEGTGGTGWVSRQVDNAVIANLDAAKITTGFLDVANRLNADSITTRELDSLAITAKHTLTGPTIQTEATASRGVKINSTGFTAYDSTGTPTFTITAATGAVAMLGSLTSGSTIAGATVTGVLQTTTTASRGIKITSNGLVAYNSSGGVTLNADASAGTLAIVGDLNAGSNINAAMITGTTGLQTDAAASRGLKINSSGLTAYDSGGIPTFTLTAATGAVTMLGSLTSGSTIAGATITGVLQTTTTASRGIKITSTGLVAYNSSGVVTLNADANAGTLAIVGDLNTGSNINGAVVTGTSGLQTTTASSLGVKINSSGIVAYNSTGTPTFTVTAATGAVSMLGSLTTGSSLTNGVVTGSEINSSTFRTVAIGASDLRGFILNSYAMYGYSNIGALTVSLDSQTGRLMAAGGVNVLSPEDVNLTSNNVPPLKVGPATGVHLRIDGNEILAMNTTTAQGTLYLNTGGVVSMSGTLIGPVTITNPTLSNPTITTGNATGGFTVAGGLTVSSGGISGSGGITFAGAVTFSNIAAAGTIAVYADVNGKLQRGSSSLRYKENYRAMREDVALRLLDVDPIVWQYKDRESHGDRLYGGFPAEGVHAAGLGLFVDYDGQDRPDNVRIQDLTAPLLVIVKRQQRQIDELLRWKAEMH